MVIFMTEKQKAIIERMRRTGVTYRKIAEQTGISINTVKSHCKRNNIKKAKSETEAADICLNCGKAIVQREKVKKRKFCCDKCKTEWWNSHPEAVRRKANYEKKCAFCGKSFIAYGNKNRKYCSHPCYINARFKSQTDDKEA